MEARWDGGARTRCPEVVGGWRGSVIVWSRGNAWSGWRLGGVGVVWGSGEWGCDLGWGVMCKNGFGLGFEKTK